MYRSWKVCRSEEEMAAREERIWATESGFLKTATFSIDTFIDKLKSCCMNCCGKTDPFFDSFHEIFIWLRYSVMTPEDELVELRDFFDDFDRFWQFWFFIFIRWNYWLDHGLVRGLQHESLAICWQFDNATSKSSSSKMRCWMAIAIYLGLPISFRHFCWSSMMDSTRKDIDAGLVAWSSWYGQHIVEVAADLKMVYFIVWTSVSGIDQVRRIKDQATVTVSWKNSFVSISDLEMSVPPTVFWLNCEAEHIKRSCQ